MHKYRAAAKRAAWYADEDDQAFTQFNPFRKSHAHTRSRTRDDIEAPLRIQSNRSENFMSPTVETNRLSQNLAEQQQMPQHASTMPTSARVPATLTDDHKPQGPNAAAVEPLNEKKKDTSEESAPLTTSDTAVSSTESPAPQQQGVVSDKSDNHVLRRRILDTFHKDTSAFPGENALKPEPTSPPDSEHNTTKKKPGFFENPDPKRYNLRSQIRGTIFSSYVNILLVFVPVGIAVNYVNVSRVAVFVINFIAIIPLAGMLSYATEEIAMHVGETLGGLLNASFGNAVELIVSIIALVKNEIDIVQESLIGSMLSNLLLVLGMCFFFGGISRVKQHFNQTVAQTASSLLALAIGSLIIPAAFVNWADGSYALKESSVTKVSRGTAVMLLLTYIAYLFFQLKTHTDMYNAPSPKVEKRTKKVEAGASIKALANAGASASAAAGGQVNQERPTRDPTDDEDEEQPHLLGWVALLTLAVSTALVGVCAEYMVDSINAITDTGDVSRTFVGLILLPIVGNAAEHATAVTVACKDKMDLAIGVAIGSSMQVALLVIPFMVVLGWILGKEDMNLAFNGFQITILFVAILLVNYLIQDGESHWLEGWLLQTLYIIIALAAWFYPPDDPNTPNVKRAWPVNGVAGGPLAGALG